MSPVFSDREVPKLRKMPTELETHVRALEAMRTPSHTYSTFLLPAIMKKLPETICLSLVEVREKLSTEWTTEAMLRAFLKQIEYREERKNISRPTPAEYKDSKEFPKKLNERLATGAALLTKSDEIQCAYCRGKHRHEQCTKVTSLDDRKKLLRKYARCFLCMRKGHRAKACRSKEKCNNCKGFHHNSICEKQVSKEVQETSTNKIPEATETSVHVSSGGGGGGGGE